MSLAAAIKSHLPAMRRYARALTGSGHKGDFAVRVVLETLLKTPDALPTDMDERLAFYRMIGMAVDLGQSRGPGAVHDWEVCAHDRLFALPANARQAFLLQGVEKLEINDIARVLGASPDAVRGFLCRALKGIMAQIATEVFIIEDEPLIALELEEVTRSLGHTVSGAARTHGEALTMYSHLNPGLVLADIQLADGTSGLAAVNDMMGFGKAVPPVIFITGSPVRLLTGDRPDPAFLVAKPFMADAIKATVTQVLFFRGIPDAVA